MKHLISTALTLSALLAGSAHSSSFNYSFVELGFGRSETEIDGASFDIDGNQRSISGNFELNETFFVGAGYSFTDFDFDIDGTTLGFNIGAHTSASDTTDLFATVRFIDAEIEDNVTNLSEDDTGYGFSVGVRHALNSQIELNVGAVSSDLFDETDTALQFGGVANLTENFSVGLTIFNSDDTNGFNLPIRFYID